MADVWSAGPAVGVLDSIFLRMHAMQNASSALAQQQRGFGGEHIISIYHIIAQMINFYCYTSFDRYNALLAI